MPLTVFPIRVDAEANSFWFTSDFRLVVRSMSDWIARIEEICCSSALVSLGWSGSCLESSVKMILEKSSALRELKPDAAVGELLFVCERASTALIRSLPLHALVQARASSRRR